MATRLRVTCLVFLLASPLFTAGCEGTAGDGLSQEAFPEESCRYTEERLEDGLCTPDGASCPPGLLCLYGSCEASPIFPPPKELWQLDAEPFVLNEETRILLPENPSKTHQKAAQLLQEQIAASFGIPAGIHRRTGGGIPANSIVVGAANSDPAIVSLLRAECAQIPPEGPAPLENYVLKITPSRIVVAGRGDRGALHGAQALKQFIRGVSPMSPQDSLPPISVRDYPDTEQRGFVIIFAHYHFPADEVRNGHTAGYKYMDLPFRLDTARAYLGVLSEFRFNTVLLKMADMVAWENLPQAEHTAVSVQDFLGLVREANEYGLETIPLLNASSAHNGWMGTAEAPFTFTEEFAKRHNDEHLAIYLALVREIAEAYEGVQPLRFFHAGLDEDWSLGLRPADHHLQWVDAIYSEVTSQAMKMMIWHDNWTNTQHFLARGDDYPDMSVLVWDYGTPIQSAAKEAVELILDRGLETRFTFWGNGVPADFEWSFSLDNPLQRGFVGVHWVRGTACTETSSERYAKTVNTYMRKHANQFWNAQHLE